MSAYGGSFAVVIIVLLIVLIVIIAIIIAIIVSAIIVLLLVRVLLIHLTVVFTIEPSRQLVKHRKLTCQPDSSHGTLIDGSSGWIRGIVLDDGIMSGLQDGSLRVIEARQERANEGLVPLRDLLAL